MRADAQCGRDPTGPIRDRSGNGRQPFLELLVDDREPLPPDVIENPAEFRFVDDGLLRIAGHRSAGEISLKFRLREEGQEHPALRGRMCRKPGSDRDRKRHQPAGLAPRDVEDLGVIEDGDRSRLTRTLRQGLEVRPREAPSVVVAGERLRQVEDRRVQGERAPLRVDIAKVGEGEKDPTGGGACEAGSVGDLADRQSRGVRRECPQYCETPLERLEALTSGDADSVCVSP